MPAVETCALFVLTAEPPRRRGGDVVPAKLELHQAPGRRRHGAGAPRLDRGKMRGH